jgi:hypothetical protein
MSDVLPRGENDAGMIALAEAASRTASEEETAQDGLRKNNDNGGVRHRRTKGLEKG